MFAPEAMPGQDRTRDAMATPQDLDPRREREPDDVARMGEGYFILGMAVQVGLVGLVGLALVGVQGLGFLTLGTAVALAGLAIGVLAIGSILTLASLRHTLNVVYDQDNRIDRLAQRLGAITEDLGVGDEEVGWGTAGPPEMDVAPPPQGPEDPSERRPSPGPGSGPDPLEEAQTYSPIEVPGIDAEATEELAEMDVDDTSDLWEADPMYVAGRLGAEPDEVRRWQAMAQLMTIEGVDGEAAEHLSRAGITTLEQLAHETPERVMRRLDEVETGEQASVDPQQAHDWIQGARVRAEAAAGTSSSEGAEA